MNVWIFTIFELELAHVDHAWADADEEHALVLVLGAVLGRDHVHGCLGGSIQRSSLDIVIANQLNVSHPTGNTDHLLGGTVEDQGQEGVVEVDIAEDVDIQQLVEVLCKLLGLGLGTIEKKNTMSVPSFSIPRKDTGVVFSYRTSIGSKESKVVV